MNRGKEMNSPGRRECRAAATRIGILRAALELIGEGYAEDASVQEICERAGVSKPTFFQYFQRKEELFAYFMAIWRFGRELELQSQGLSGRAALERIFASAAAESQPGVFLELLVYIARLREPPPEFALSRAERRLLYPDLADDPRLETLRSLALPALLERELRIAQRRGELPPRHARSSLRTLTASLSALFYGAPLAAHTGRGSLGELYAAGLEMMFMRDS